ncbi:MAG: DUF1232 domain-containing protein [Deltaproteobacteria bacterium]
MTDERRRADFYQALRARIADWLASKGKGFKHAQLLLLAPDLFHLLTRLMLDRRIPVAEKAGLGAALAYFVSPIDLLPEAFLGPAGYVDDVALAAFALSRLINAGHGEVAKELWAGDGDLLDAIQQILDVADQALGSGLWERLKNSWRGLG